MGSHDVSRITGGYEPLNGKKDGPGKACKEVWPRIRRQVLNEAVMIRRPEFGCCPRKYVGHVFRGVRFGFSCSDDLRHNGPPALVKILMHVWSQPKKICVVVNVLKVNSVPHHV